MATPISGAERWLTIQHSNSAKPPQYLSLQSNDDNARLDIREYNEYEIRLTTDASEIDNVGLFIDDETLKTEIYGKWLWRPKDHAGLYKFEFRGRNITPYITHIRVFPHKFTQKRYEKMQSEISQIALDLLFRLNSPAQEHAISTSDARVVSALHDYQQIRRIVTQLVGIIAEIRREPHQTLHEQTSQQEWHTIAT